MTPQLWTADEYHRPGPQKWGSRERQWLPIHHDTPDGQPCAGDKRAL